MKSTKLFISAAALLAVTLLIAGCSGGGDGEEAGSSGFSAEAKADAAKLVAEFSETPNQREIEPLSAKPDKQFVVNISCPLPACAVNEPQFDAAVAALGWESKTLVYDFTTESYISTFESALQLDPDGIYYINNLPDETIEQQLQTAQDRGIWVTAAASPKGTDFGKSSPVDGSVTNAKDREQVSNLQGAIVVADEENAGGKIVYMFDPASASYSQGVEDFQAYIEKAGGEAEGMEINQAEGGTTLPGKIVSYLQRNPDVEYLVAPHDAFLLGVPEAIASAGIDSPKLIGFAPQEANVKYIKEGQQLASVQYDSMTAMWDILDIFARMSVGDPIVEPQPLGLVQIVDKSNIDGLTPQFPGATDGYPTAWLVD